MAAAVATACIEFGLVGGRHDRHVRHAAEITDVEGAGMGGAIGADQAGAVDGEAHGQGLQHTSCTTWS